MFCVVSVLLWHYRVTVYCPALVFILSYCAYCYIEIIVLTLVLSYTHQTICTFCICSLHTDYTVLLYPLVWCSVSLQAELAVQAFYRWDEKLSLTASTLVPNCHVDDRIILILQIKDFLHWQTMQCQYSFFLFIHLQQLQQPGQGRGGSPDWNTPWMKCQGLWAHVLVAI